MGDGGALVAYHRGVRTPARGLNLAGLVLVLAATPACVISFGDDDAIEPCKLGDGTAGAPAGTFLLDPDSLTCREVGFGCDTTCGACDEPPVAPPTWAQCQSQCTGLDERTCGATAGCRTAWDFACRFTEQLCNLPDPYFGCFATDTTGPVQGSCQRLDAFECSRHDDCEAAYRRDERCADGTDGDGDGAVDEPDECLTFALCAPEAQF